MSSSGLCGHCLQMTHRHTWRRDTKRHKLGIKKRFPLKNTKGKRILKIPNLREIKCFLPTEDHTDSLPQAHLPLVIAKYARFTMLSNLGAYLNLCINIRSSKCPIWIDKISVLALSTSIQGWRRGVHWETALTQESDGRGVGVVDCPRPWDLGQVASSPWTWILIPNL